MQLGGRIPSLDGLRALSIAAVLIGHSAGTQGFPTRLGQLVLGTHPDIANIGVRVFFVISGFLITGLLHAEHRQRGEVSIKRFYLRRVLRIAPAYAAFLLAILLADALGIISVSRTDAARALTFTMNYSLDPEWHLGHLWSLAVEEQFYLLWPALLVLATPKRAWRLALVALCVIPLVRVIQATWWPSYDALIGTSFETSADAIALGCILASCRDWLWSRPSYRWAVETVWVAPLLMLLGLLVGPWDRPAYLIGYPLINVAIMLGVDRVVRRPSGRLGRVLNSRGLVLLGTLSYSIYLWQQPFVNRNSSSALAAFPLNIVLALAAATASYCLVERPFLQLRQRLELRWLGPRRSAARVEPATSH